MVFVVAVGMRCTPSMFAVHFLSGDKRAFRRPAGSDRKLCRCRRRVISRNCCDGTWKVGNLGTGGALAVVVL
jgi:hypothetical protein